MATIAGEEGDTVPQRNDQTSHDDMNMSPLSQLKLYPFFSDIWSPKANVREHVPMEPARYIHFRRTLLELFSVKFPRFKKYDLDQMNGYILLCADKTYVVYERKPGAPLNIDSEGSVKLRGPNKVLDACDYAHLVPHLFRYEAGVDQFKENKELTIWNNYTGGRKDWLLTRSVQSQFGPIVVNYVVYVDSAEAWVDVAFAHCQLPAVVYGTITARNSELLHKEARSILFNKNREEGINVVSDEGKLPHLPLSRHKTVHPFGSVVTISLNIMQCGNTEAEDKPIARNADFRFTTQLSGQERQIIGSGACLVEVSITWRDRDECMGNSPCVV